MNGISLCAGVEGIGLGLKLAVPSYRTVCYVEIESFPQDVLFARMADGVIDRAPIWGDIKRFDARPWRGLVDLVHGGYPCQPFSVAGKRLGEADPRHLWPDVARVVRESKPEWCFFENVAGHLRLGFDVVARDLVDMGYRVAAGLFTAEEVGAPHRRQRLFILAHAANCRSGASGSFGGVGGASSRVNRNGVHVADASSRITQQAPPSQSDDTRRVAVAGAGRVGDVGDADDPRLEGRRESVRERSDQLAAWPPGPSERDQWERVLAARPWLAPATVADAKSQRRGEAGRHSERCTQRTTECRVVADTANGDTRSAGSGCDARRAAEGNATEPAVRRVADGAPRRVDRLKALGNGVVPAVAALAWRTLYRQLTQED